LSLQIDCKQQRAFLLDYNFSRIQLFSFGFVMKQLSYFGNSFTFQCTAAQWKKWTK